MRVLNTEFLSNQDAGALNDETTVSVILYAESPSKYSSVEHDHRPTC